MVERPQPKKLFHHPRPIKTPEVLGGSIVGAAGSVFVQQRLDGFGDPHLVEAGYVVSNEPASGGVHIGWHDRQGVGIGLCS